MRLMKQIALTGAFLAASVASFAGPKLAVGTVNMQEVFKEAPQIQAIDKKLKKQFYSQQQKLIKMQASLEKAQKEIKKNKPTASKSHMEMLNKNFVAQLQAFQKEQASYKKAVYDAQTQAMNGFTNQVKDVISGVAKKEGFDVVLPQRELLYAGADLDLTKPVLTELKKQGNKHHA